MNSKDFFSEQERISVQEAIASAENLTSGEIRVHISKSCKGDVYVEATKVFKKLKMHATKDRNGVLIYIAPSDKKLAIIGDKGINEKVSSDFWDMALKIMQEKFAVQEYSVGLIDAIHLAGNQLKSYFPYLSNDKNELDNDISYGE